MKLPTNLRRFWWVLPFIPLAIEIALYAGKPISTIDPSCDSTNIRGIVSDFKFTHGIIEVQLVGYGMFAFAPEGVGEYKNEFEQKIRIGDTLLKQALADSVFLKRGATVQGWKITRKY